MDVQQYISSGIIEIYMLGMASEVEVRELHSLCEQYPEIKAAVLSAQADIDQYANLHTIEPPASMKEQIWATLQEADATNNPDATTEAAVSNVIAFDALGNKSNTIVRPMWVAAAVVIVISIGLNFFFWNKSKITEQELASLQTAQQQTIASKEAYKQKLEAINNILLDPAMKQVLLAGTGSHPEAKAMLFWDGNSKDIYLSLKNMPQLPAGKQYQLWAIVDGKPVDAGVYALEQHESLQKMKAIPNAQMFAITIENEGGSPTPTLDQMILAGKV